MDSPTVILIALVAAILAACLSWEASATRIGTECERLGGFWAGSTVYECKKKDAQ